MTVSGRAGTESHPAAGVVRAVRELARVPARLIVQLLRVYQKIVSPLYGPSCRFYPSCSNYAVVAVQRHGVIRGGGLAVWRLLRCNPWNAGGVDDVPPGRGPARTGQR